MWNKASWLGVPNDEIRRWNIAEGDMTGRFAYFTYVFSAKNDTHLTINITANSKYRLWLNGTSVLSGPCKGDKHSHYYDTVKLDDYIQSGENLIAVQVLYCVPDAVANQLSERASIYGVCTPEGGHRLAIEGTLYDDSGKELGTIITGDGDWHVYLDGSFYLHSNEVTVYLGAIQEKLDLNEIPIDWKTNAEISSNWANAVIVESVVPSIFMQSVGITPRFKLKERPIPLLYETHADFLREITKTELLKNEMINISGGHCETVILDVGYILNSYPQYHLKGGKNRRIKITYFEKFTKNGVELVRDDWKNGEIHGLTDEITLCGDEVIYEPFWYRTCRFIQIEIGIGDEDVTLFTPKLKKTGYPIHIGSNITSSAAWVGDVWEICVRTLQNCMMDTYMDCPFYEQLQYPMDTRLQALFTYTVSSDAKLARKALHDFHSAMLPCGLIPGKAPSAYEQIISTFSLHYIYMLWEYYEQTADIDVLKEYRTDVDAILSYYDRHMEDNGLIGSLGYWEFVDWQKAWAENNGVPTALKKDGQSTIINLMYAYALKCGALINKSTGRTGIYQEYISRQQEILDAVERNCWDEETGMYKEGINLSQYSQHAQSWAALNGLPNAEKAVMQAIDNDNVLKCSFSTSYEFFRAIEQVGCYEKVMPYIMKWAKLTELGCTTCPETPALARSDCHAWSALPMYELIRSFVGIRCGTPGWKDVVIKPYIGGLPDLKGTAETPKGKINFDYHCENGIWNYQIAMPEDLHGRFIYPDGRIAELKEGEEVCLK